MSKLAKVIYWVGAISLAIVLAKVIPSATGISWLSESVGFGFGPIDIDLHIIDFTLGINLSVNLCNIIVLAIAAAIFYFVNNR